MALIRTFRDLQVWQKAMAFVLDVYRESRSLPAEEQYGLTSQLRRCAVSIPSNIAEGFSRPSRIEFARFLRVALGSLFEAQTQLEIAGRLGYLPPSRHEDLFEKTREIERMMTSLIAKISKKEKA